LLLNQVVPYLKKMKSLGISTIFECTAAYFGRDVETLKALADTTGMQIVTNTGFYGGYNDYYVPKSALTMSEEKIAQIWIDEFEKGIDQTGIKPGFIKLGFDDGTPSDIDKKLFRAGVIAHISTGLTIEVHTGNNPAAATEQLSILEEKKVSPSAWVWVHANKVTNNESLIAAAKKGAWISLDGVNESNKAEYVTKINLFKAQNLL
jgi:predicted metal-dependent phosphotriesterase family hydrolase